jgi:hypothetical protein
VHSAGAIVLRIRILRYYFYLSKWIHTIFGAHAAQIRRKSHLGTNVIEHAPFAQRLNIDLLFSMLAYWMN